MALAAVAHPRNPVCRLLLWLSRCQGPGELVQTQASQTQIVSVVLWLWIVIEDFFLCLIQLTQLNLLNLICSIE